MTVYDRFLRAINHQESSPVPVVGWDNAVPITRMARILAKDYYRNPEVKFFTQKMVLDQFPSIRWVPGFHADFGVVVEPSAFGCEIEWFEDDSPYAHPILNDLNNIDKLKIPDPYMDGLMPEALSNYKFFWEKIEKKYIDEYGYLDGFAFTLGPLETAASLRGYGNLLFDLHDNPSKIHKLLEMIVEGLLRWIDAQEKINGKIKLLILVDHLPGNISLNYSQEYAFPYFKQIFDEYPSAIHIYHNEGKSDHYVSHIPDFGAHVFHCGKVDLEHAKNIIGDRLCFMGNIDANEVLLPGTPDLVKQVCLEKLRIAAPGGGYLLCTGGAMAPGTKEENIWAMVKASDEYEIEKNKKNQKD